MKGHWSSLPGYVLPPLLFLALVVALWHLAAVWFELPSYLVPRPGEVVAVALRNAGAIGSAMRITASAALCGFALSLMAGTLVAFAFSQSRLIERSLYPYAIFLQTVPIVAIAPLIVTWFGTGFRSVVIAAFIISLFPIITSATAGLTAVDPNLRELFQLYNASRWQTLIKLRLPHAVPYLVTGAKVSSGLAVIGSIVGEFFVGYGARSHGLGYLIVQTSGQLKTDYLFAAVLASTTLGLAIFAAVSLFGALLLRRWHVATPSRGLSADKSPSRLGQKKTT